MTLSRAHTSAAAADGTKLLQLKKHHVKYLSVSITPAPPNRNPSPTPTPTLT